MVRLLAYLALGGCATFHGALDVHDTSEFRRLAASYHLEDTPVHIRIITEADVAAASADLLGGLSRPEAIQPLFADTVFVSAIAVTSTAVALPETRWQVSGARMLPRFDIAREFIALTHEREPPGCETVRGPSLPEVAYVGYLIRSSIGEWFGATPSRETHQACPGPYADALVAPVAGALAATLAADALAARRGDYEMSVGTDAVLVLAARPVPTGSWLALCLTVRAPDDRAQLAWRFELPLDGLADGPNLVAIGSLHPRTSVVMMTETQTFGDPSATSCLVAGTASDALAARIKAAAR